ncbi:transcriptional regulator, TetR family [Seinonella peptonophila]|uniref:Transcriptional regulator, TetR family n=1 Tax=Seinonella peptonophila TaxID=112248 RepID=A0A1M5BM88_9BACL|nr:TetR/AcrR family transcriptional regulator [Seinonella peptonophila]SHF43516.1 transcriptional regulator, TetR family [Seinonella peptonophila]
MQHSSKMNTSDQLMLTAIDLMSEKGYNGVSTKEIAEKAGFSEKTLFRHFGNKRNILATAFNRFHYGPEMDSIFFDQIKWNLKADLQLISATYQGNMDRNRKLIKISQKMETDEHNELKKLTHDYPRQLKKYLTQYFSEMIRQKKVIQTDPEIQARMFLVMNYGAFMHGLETSLPEKDFISESVQLFTRGLSP